MRIIAGQRRGHKFDGPKGGKTRPTSDLVRESLFNILGTDVEGRWVLDLFAGTGALGLEALSRGAARALFVESNRENVALIHRNLTTLRYEDRGRVHCADVFRWTRGFVPADAEPLIVLVDPPYRVYQDQSRKVRDLFTLLSDRLPAGTLIAAESSVHIDPEVLPDRSTWDVRRYGGTQIAIGRVTAEDHSAVEPAAMAPSPDLAGTRSSSTEESGHDVDR